MARVLRSLFLVVFLVSCGSLPVEEARPAGGPAVAVLQEEPTQADLLAALIHACLDEKGSPLAGLGAHWRAC